MNIPHFRQVPHNHIHIPDHVDADPIEGLEIINIATCQSAAYANNVNGPENKGIVGLILSIRHISQTQDRLNLMTSGLPRHTQGGNSYNRQRINPSRPYDRLLHVADLSSNNGQVFSVICATTEDSKTFFNYCHRGSEGVGSIIVIDEPNAISQTLGSTSSVPILANYFRVVPIVPRYTNLIPNIDVQLPEAGHTIYFAQHNKITLGIGNARIVNAVCNGSLCDRQNTRLLTGARCGCFYKISGPNIVLSLSISIPLPVTIQEEEVFNIEDFRSWRTSKLFVQDDVWIVLDPRSVFQRRVLRQAIQDVTTHINVNGGWTYIGWLRRGVVVDMSDNRTREVDNIASQEQTPHLSLLYPSNPDSYINNAAFNNAQLTLAKLQPPAAAAAAIGPVLGAAPPGP